MEENNINKSDHQKQGVSSSPYLSKRGKYSPSSKESNTSASETLMQYANPQQAYTNQQPHINTQVPSPQGKPKHSGLGIASFIVSLVAIAIGVISFILIIVAMMNLAGQDPNSLMGLEDPDVFTNMLLEGEMSGGFSMILVASLLLLLSCGVSFIGGVLGIIAIIQKNRRKVFSVLGLIFNSIVFFGFIFLFLIGLAIQ